MILRNIGDDQCCDCIAPPDETLAEFLNGYIDRNEALHQLVQSGLSRAESDQFICLYEKRWAEKMQHRASATVRVTITKDIGDVWMLIMTDPDIADDQGREKILNMMRLNKRISQYLREALISIDDELPE